MKYESKIALYNLIILTMFKTDKNNCLSILNNLKKTDVSFLLTLIENNIVAVIHGATLTRNMAENIHNIYYCLMDNYKENRVEIVNSYNMMKSNLNKASYDEHEHIIFEDIRLREFGVTGILDFFLSLKKCDEFYNQNYKEIMNNIAFDYDTIAYLINKSVEDNDSILYDPRFNKSIRCICILYPELLDDIEFKEKVETILKLGKTNKQIKKECQKTLRIIKKL